MSEKQKNKIWFVLIALGALLCIVPVGFRIFKPLKIFPFNEVNVLFRESITQVTPTQGDVLDVAVLETNDTITRRDSRTLFDHSIDLGTTVSEIKVKVTYRYHILLSDEWQISLRENDLVIIAPQIRATLPPAIHTDQMEKRSDAGWLRFNARENLEALERSLTPTLSNLALTPAKMMLVKESARSAIEKFVRSWVLSRKEWEEHRSRDVKIYFSEDVLSSPP